MTVIKTILHTLHLYIPGKVLTTNLEKWRGPRGPLINKFRKV